MFASTLTLVLLAASSLAAPLRSPRAYKPASYREDILEQYATYHSRYMALSCQDNHAKQFFDDCCHPLLKNELLSSRPAQCTPSAPASSSAVRVESSLSDDGCGDEESTSVAPPASTSAVQATTTSRSVVATTSVAHPVETTSKTIPPQTTTTTKASTSAQPTQTSGGGGGGEVNKGGFATFFYQGGVAGACGKVHDDSELIVAMDERRYGNPGKKSDLCGKQVKITNPKNNKSVVVTVADDCPTCKNSNSIDMSSGAFAKIATYDEGMVSIEWSFV